MPWQATSCPREPRWTAPSWRIYEPSRVNGRAGILIIKYSDHIEESPGALRHSADEFGNKEKQIEVSPLLSDVSNHAAS
jgi:hypothetical protein